MKAVYILLYKIYRYFVKQKHNGKLWRQDIWYFGLDIKKWELSLEAGFLSLNYESFFPPSQERVINYCLNTEITPLESLCWKIHKCAPCINTTLVQSWEHWFLYTDVPLRHYSLLWSPVPFHALPPCAAKWNSRANSPFSFPFNLHSKSLTSLPVCLSKIK